VGSFSWISRLILVWGRGDAMRGTASGRWWSPMQSPCGGARARDVWAGHVLEMEMSGREGSLLKTTSRWNNISSNFSPVVSRVWICIRIFWPSVLNLLGNWKL